MMKTFFGYAASGASSLMIFLLAACSSMRVNSAQAPNTDLSQYHTFAWAKQSSDNSSPQSSILDQSVKTDVENQLASKGLTPATNSPDLLISYSAKSKDSLEYGAEPGWWGAPYAYTVHEGDLTLHFVDPKTNKVVWQATAQDTIGNAGESQKQIEQAVQAMIKKYPPVA
jgi:hypothetical protein